MQWALPTLSMDHDAPAPAWTGVSSTRGDLIALSRLTLSRAWARLRDAGWIQLEGVYQHWDQRLLAEAGLLPHFVVPSDVAGAVTDLVRGLEDQAPESLVDWLDMLPRSVVDLLSVQLIAIRVEPEMRVGEGLENQPPTDASQPAVERAIGRLAQAA
jgi:hypothetical protein